MKYMDKDIVKGAFNDKYGNNVTCIASSIHDNVINIEGRY